MRKNTTAMLSKLKGKIIRLKTQTEIKT